MTKKRAIPGFYFAFRSPYSWIAFRLLEEKFADINSQLEYIPFWEPDPQTLALVENLGGDSPYTSMSKAKHLYILQDIKRLTTKLGYDMVWPVDTNPWWDLPHLAYLMARKLGKGHEFIRRTYRARWQDGLDICSIPVMQQIAVEIDIDPNVLVTAPNDPTIRAEGAEALYRAYRNDVFGVPFFTYRYEKFWGVDRLEEFIERLSSLRQSKANDNGASVKQSQSEEIVEDTLQDISMDVRTSHGCYDTDVVGGCG